jgi:RNA recognition motif-containing protein
MRTDAVTARGTTIPGARIRTLYVGGFGTAVSSQELRALLERHGQIDELRLVDRGDASFAYVTFAAEDHATAARKQLDGHAIAGRTLRVERAQ